MYKYKKEIPNKSLSFVTKTSNQTVLLSGVARGTHPGEPKGSLGGVPRTNVEIDRGFGGTMEAGKGRVKYHPDPWSKGKASTYQEKVRIDRAFGKTTGRVKYHPDP